MAAGSGRQVHHEANRIEVVRLAACAHPIQLLLYGSAGLLELKPLVFRLGFKSGLLLQDRRRKARPVRRGWFGKNRTEALGRCWWNRGTGASWQGRKLWQRQSCQNPIAEGRLDPSEQTIYALKRADGRSCSKQRRRGS